MSIAIITDTHFGAKNDSLEFQKYIECFYEEVFFPEIISRKIKRIIHQGDVCDRRKYVNYRTLKHFYKTFLDKIPDGVTCDILVGNHDTFYRNVNDINSMELLTGGYDNVNVYTKPEHVIIDGVKCLYVPWIPTDKETEYLKIIKNSDAVYCFGHLEVDGFAMYKGYEANTGLDRKIFKNFKRTFSGHYHTQSEKDNIKYLGAPYQITWHDYDDPRGFHTYDLKKDELEFIKNPYTLFHKVYYDDTKNDYDKFDYSTLSDKYVKIYVVSKTDYKKYDEFMDKVGNSDCIELSVHDEFELSDVDVDDDENDEQQVKTENTFDILGSYVSSLDIEDRDKNDIKGVLKELYLEASSMER